MSEERPVVTREHLPGLLLAQRECRRYEDLQFLNFLIDKARSAGPVEAGMSDKVLIARELLEHLADIAEIEGQPEGAQARALLAVLPQAAHKAVLSCTASELIHYGPAQELTVLTAHPQASAGNPSYLCHHCSTPLMMHGQQIYCPKCARKQPQASAAQNQCGECGFPNGAGPHCGCHGAAQSAPAGEREIVEQQILGRYTVHPTGRGFWPYCVRAGDGERELFVGHKRKCEEVADELQAACLDGALMQSAWQRTQSAWVPEAVREWMLSVSLPDNEYGHRMASKRDELIAVLAAPAHPAAQDQDQGEVQRLREALSRARDVLQIMRQHEDQPNGYKYPVSLWFPAIDAALAASTGQEV